jgi:hypothetical protein
LIRVTEFVLTVAVALGITLALRYLRNGRLSAIGIVHGLTGAAGLVSLVLALRGPRHGDAMGVGSFGAVAAMLLGLALALGPFIPFLHRRTPRVTGLTIAAHAGLAITAFVLFLAWASLS